MEWPSKLLRLLVLAHASAALACSVLPLELSDSHSPIGIAVTFSLACCQINLAAAWTVLVASRWTWGLLWTSAPIAVWVWVHGNSQHDYVQWTAFLLPMAMATALIEGAARFALGFRLEVRQIGVIVDGEDHSRDRRQFSLLSLIVFTTLTAIACALARLFAATWIRFGGELVVYITAAVFTNVLLLHAWFFPDRRKLIRTTAFLIAAAGGALLRDSHAPSSLNLLISTFHCALSVATLEALRICGIRLTRMADGHRPSNGQATRSDAESQAIS